MAAGTLADDDPETAWSHARAARARGGRIAVVRETVGLVAYRAGEWAEAIGELRAARRMGGGPGHLAVLADCERALGHPEKAVELARSEQAAELDADARIELATVVAGARADLGQTDAGLAHLEQFDVQERGRNPRLGYAYADLLDRAGRPAEALTWFIRAANADTDEDTDALERVETLAAIVGSATGDGSGDRTGAPTEGPDDVEAGATVDAAAPEPETGGPAPALDPTVAGPAAAAPTENVGDAAAPSTDAQNSDMEDGDAPNTDPQDSDPQDSDAQDSVGADGGADPAVTEPTVDNGPDNGPDNAPGDEAGTGNEDTEPTDPASSGPAGPVTDIPQMLFSHDRQ